MSKKHPVVSVSALALVGFALGCGGGDDASDPAGDAGGGASVATQGGAAGAGTGGTGGAKAGAAGKAGSGIVQTPSGGAAGTTQGGKGGAPGPWSLPAGFTPSDVGGWLLGAAIPPGGETTGSGEQGCVSEVRGILRDFRRGDKPGGHPDFETIEGDGETGIVEQKLGADRKPVYVDGKHKLMTTKANFDQWYRDVPEVNLPYFVSFSLAPSNGTYTFSSEEFFPLDSAGYGKEGLERNFGFTTEVHTKVAYNGGETFTFTGDDDLWVFINDTLAIDLGGLHSSKTKTVHLDEIAGKLGIEKGKTYGLDLFHAERHSTASHFRIETTLEFTDCGTFVPSDPK